MESRCAAAAAFVCLFAADQVASDAGARGDDEVEDNDEQYIYIDLTIYSSLISRIVRNVWVSGVQRVGIWE